MASLPTQMAVGRQCIVVCLHVAPGDGQQVASGEGVSGGGESGRHRAQGELTEAPDVQRGIHSRRAILQWQRLPFH